jgi:DNA transformation protein
MLRQSFEDFVADQLRPLGQISVRRMFGGAGIYRHGVFFGILYKGRLYFRTDEASRPDYRTRGMKPFRPKAGMTLKSYYEVPPEILEEGDLLASWAQRALATRVKTAAPVKRGRAKSAGRRRQSVSRR